MQSDGKRSRSGNITINAWTKCHNCTIVLQPIHDTMTYILWLTDFIFHCKKRNGLVVAEYICRKKTIVKGPLQDYLHPCDIDFVKRGTSFHICCLQSSTVVQLAVLFQFPLGFQRIRLYCVKCNWWMQSDGKRSRSGNILKLICIIDSGVVVKISVGTKIIISDEVHRKNLPA
jgi:hypothetical protein